MGFTQIHSISHGTTYHTGREIVLLSFEEEFHTIIGANTSANTLPSIFEHNSHIPYLRVYLTLT
jgi:hypothetical protein